MKNDYNGRNGNGYQPLPTPPTTEYVGVVVCKGDVKLGSGCGKCSRCQSQMNNDLPLLPSERRQLENKVKEAIAKYETAYANALRHVTYVINTHEGLTQEQRDSIIYRIWHE